MITTFNFFDYHKNPIVQWIMGFYNDIQILTLSDCMSDIMKLRHSRLSLENDKKSFIGDELRLYYASISNDFIYVDSDCLVQNINELDMNCVCLDEKGKTNDGSYFRANSETEWVRYYLKIYETKDVGRLCNYQVHKAYPTYIPTQKLEHDHFFINRFSRFPKQNIIYYTYNSDVPKTFDKPIWLLSPNYRTNGDITKSFNISSHIPEEVFIEQLKYSMQIDNLKIIKIE